MQMMKAFPMCLHVRDLPIHAEIEVVENLVLQFLLGCLLPDASEESFRRGGKPCSGLTPCYDVFHTPQSRLHIRRHYIYLQEPTTEGRGEVYFPFLIPRQIIMYPDSQAAAVLSTRRSLN